MPRLIRLLRRLWRPVLRIGTFLNPIRFVVLPLALLASGIFATNQGSDAMRALVEFDRQCPRWDGIVAFVVATTFLAFQAWFWSRSLLRIDFSQPPESAASADRERRATTRAELWAPRLLGLTGYVIVIAALIRIWREYDASGRGTGRVILVACLLLAGAAALFLIFVVLRRRALRAPPKRADWQSDLGRSTQVVLIVTGVTGVAFLVLTAVSPLTVGEHVSSPSLLVISTAIWIALGSWVVYWSDRYRIPLMTTLLLLAAVFSLWNDNHRIRSLSASDGGGAVGARRTVAETFEGWYRRLDQAYPAEASHPVFVVATEGGGIRAAYWTASVLAELQDEAPAFGDHLFAISGVSGGSVGAAVFTALLAARGPSTIDECDTCESHVVQGRLREAVKRILSYDALAPTLASLLNADLAQRILPVAVVPDRAQALETAWERGWSTHVLGPSGRADDLFAAGMLRMYAERPDQLLPSLFLNSTSVETGARVITSNCRVTEDEFPDASDLFTRLGEDMRLSTAAHNSARFTYVSPAGTIRGCSRGPETRVVDGGYFENSGAVTAADVLRKIDAPEMHHDRDFEVVLIVIAFHDEPEHGHADRRLLAEVLAPVNAFLASRGARGTLAVKQAKLLACKTTELSHACPPDEAPPPRVVEFILARQPDGVSLPLGWLLAARTRNAIDLQIGPTIPAGLLAAPGPNVAQNLTALRAILRWLSVPEIPRPLPGDRQEAATMSEWAILYGE